MKASLFSLFSQAAMTSEADRSSSLSYGGNRNDSDDSDHIPEAEEWVEVRERGGRTLQWWAGRADERG